MTNGDILFAAFDDELRKLGMPTDEELQKAAAPLARLPGKVYRPFANPQEKQQAVKDWAGDVSQAERGSKKKRGLVGGVVGGVLGAGAGATKMMGAGGGRGALIGAGLGAGLGALTGAASAHGRNKKIEEAQMVHSGQMDPMAYLDREKQRRRDEMMAAML